jgi:hypothetical protein
VRSKRDLFLLLTLTWVLAAAGAPATVYLDEGFDEGKMPTGWQARTSGNGIAYYSFEKRAGGYCYYASVEARSEQYAAVELTSKQLTVTPGTLYYRFDFASTHYGSASTSKVFSAKYVGSSSSIFYEILPTSSGWHVETGSFYVGEAKPIVAIWEISVGAAPGRYGTGTFSLDDVAIADDPNFAVAPASVGKVRALFR